MTNGRDTKCLQVSLNPPGKEYWPSDDHHHNNNLIFVRNPEGKTDILAIKNAERRRASEPIPGMLMWLMDVGMVTKQRCLHKNLL